MSRIDPERERQRLADHYASLTDEELEALSTELDQLTEIAQGALRQEMTQRRLNFRPPEGDDRPQPKPHSQGNRGLGRPVVYREYPSLQEAESAQEVLDAAGIPSFVASEEGRGADPFKLNAAQSTKLWINDGDQEQAGAALTPRSQEDKEEEQDLAEDARFRCPSCRSDDLTLQADEVGDPDRVSVEGSQNAHSPRKWFCNACGKVWEESGTEEQADSPCH